MGERDNEPKQRQNQTTYYWERLTEEENLTTLSPGGTGEGYAKDHHGGTPVRKYNNNRIGDGVKFSRHNPEKTYGLGPIKTNHLPTPCIHRLLQNRRNRN